MITLKSNESDANSQGLADWWKRHRVISCMAMHNYCDFKDCCDYIDLFSAGCVASN